MTTTNETGAEVLRLLLAEGFTQKQARFIHAQAAHETANFTSKIFRQNNNLFGMKLARKRKTTATGEKYGHASYNDIQDSIKDYTYYYRSFNYRKEYSTVHEFIEALHKNGYFEADPEEYESAVTFFYTLYKDVA